MANSRTRNSFLNFVTGIGGHLLTTILGFVTRTVFIHTLGVEYLGIGGLFSNILQLLSLTQLGMDTAINYKLYKPLAIKDEKRIRVLMKFYKHAYRVIGCVIFILGILMIPTLPLLIKDYEKLAVLKIDASIIFCLYLLQSVSSYLFFSYRTTIIKTAQKSYVLNIVDYAISIVQAIVQISVLLLWHNFSLYVAVVIMMNLLKNCVNAIISERMFKYAFMPEHDSLSKDEIKGIFKDCLALFGYKVNGVVLKATDNIVLSKFIGLAIVGLYSNYLLFLTTIRHFLNQIYVSIKAGMGDLYASGDIKRSYFMFRFMNYVTVVLFGTALVLFSICSNELITVWLGVEYTIPQPFPILIGIELLTGGLKINLGQIRNISGAFRQMWHRPFLSIVINLVISIASVQYWGICGVITGTIVSDIFSNLLVDPKIIHEYSFKNIDPVSVYYKRNGIYFLILSVVCCIDYYICQNMVTGIGWVDLFLHVLFCGLSVPLIFMGVFYKSDVNRYLLAKVLLRKKK